MARMLDAVSGSAESGSTSEQRAEEHIQQPYRVGFEPSGIIIMIVNRSNCTVTVTGTRNLNLVRAGTTFSLRLAVTVP